MATSYPFGQLGYEVQKAIKKDLDVKILITSHNSRPGLGKTTLAIQMARQWDPNGWTAEEKAFMDVYDYRDYYMEGEKGSVLLFDELEGEADSRRSMSSKNVDLSQAWAQLRYRNMTSICTLPSVSMLDNRMLEMADYWINVLDRGVAAPHRINVNDYNGKIWREQMGPESNAIIRYPDLADDDPAYTSLTEMKDQRNRNTREMIPASKVNEKIEQAQKEARREVRDELISEIYNSTDWSYARIGELEAVDLSRERVGEICRAT